MNLRDRVLHRKHLSKYLTHENPNLRAWVKKRIHRTDQVYEVINRNINYIPKENQYALRKVMIPQQNLCSDNPGYPFKNE